MDSAPGEFDENAIRIVVASEGNVSEAGEEPEDNITFFASSGASDYVRSDGE